MKPNHAGLYLLFAASIFARPLLAQRPANPEVQTFRSFATAYGGLLVAAFDSIPAGEYTYRPTPAQRSVGDIAQHLESANYQLCAHFAGLHHAMTPKDSTADTLKARWPKDTLVARLRASLAYCDDALARVSDASLSDEIPRMGPSSGQTAPRVRFLILYVTDLVDHYSQVANYMRLNGLIPPSSLPHSGH